MSCLCAHAVADFAKHGQHDPRCSQHSTQAPTPPERPRAKRGTSNRNERGNSHDRRARRLYVFETYASNVPGRCRCFHCGELLTLESLTIDRIVPGCLGGRYTRENIRPACASCNSELGGRLAHREREGS